MSTLDEFRHDLQDALAHLHDPDYQPTERVYTAMDCNLGQEPAAVQSAIIRLLEGLKPESKMPAGNPISRDFEVLWQRFVLKLTQEETAEQLNLGVRTVQRVQRRAVYKLARNLWEQHQSPPRPTDEFAVQMAAHPPDWHIQVKQELISLRQSSPNAVADIGQALEGVLKVGRALVLPHNVSLNSIVTSPGLTAAIHPSALRQVLITAIEKLVQPMSAGEIMLQAQQKDDDIEITVTGYPLSIDTPPRSELIQEILKTQGGRVEVSLVQQRAVFQISLPSVDKKILVLVVDDNADLINFYRNYIAGSRYQIMHLAEGKQLLQIAKDSPPDIIVLDVMLPDVDGWELLTYLHEYPATRSIPVIVCSVVKRAELALALGAALYLPKPVHRQQFIQALNQVLEQAQA